MAGLEAIAARDVPDHGAQLGYGPSVDSETGDDRVKGEGV